MATNTPNYNLKKPSQSDFYNIDDHNGNMDAIDAALKQTADALKSIDLSNIPSADKQAEWNAKPTTEQAQAMATAAETNAKNASLPCTGGTVNGGLTVNTNAGGLALVGKDHFYVPYYPEGVSAGRKAYHGFAGQREHAYKLVNEYPDGTFVFEAGGKSVDIFDLKQSVSNGKAKLAGVIGNLVSTASFQSIYDRIRYDKNDAIQKLYAKGVNTSQLNPDTTTLNAIIGAISQVPTGKKYASGTAAPVNVHNSRVIRVTGLGFTPRIVFARNLGSNQASTLSYAYLINFGFVCNVYPNLNSGTIESNSTISGKTEMGNGFFTMQTGFSSNAYPFTWEWYAFE